MIVSDNATVADLGEEPEGFWSPIHDQVEAWLIKYGVQEDDGIID